MNVDKGVDLLNKKKQRKGILLAILRADLLGKENEPSFMMQVPACIKKYAVDELWKNYRVEKNKVEEDYPVIFPQLIQNQLR